MIFSLLDGSSRIENCFIRNYNLVRLWIARAFTRPRSVASWVASRFKLQAAAHTGRAKAIFTATAKEFFFKN